MVRFAPEEIIDLDEQPTAKAWRVVRRFYTPPRPLTAWEARVHIETWRCAECGHEWNPTLGEDALSVLMLGGTSSGKSTYIASLAVIRQPDWLVLFQRGDWERMRDLFGEREALPQTRLPHDFDPLRLLPRKQAAQAVSQTPAADRTQAKADLPDGGDESAAPLAGPARLSVPGAEAAPNAVERDPLERVYYLAAQGRAASSSGLFAVMLLDMPGEALAKSELLESLLTHAPDLAGAPLVIYCIDPSQLPRIAAAVRGYRLAHPVGDLPPVALPPEQVVDVIATAAHVRRHGETAKSHGHLAIVVLKSDELVEIPDVTDHPQFPARACQGIAGLDPQAAWARMQQDSEAVGAWLKDVAPGIFLEAQAKFHTTSFSMVSATGCAPQLGSDGKYRYPKVDPSRSADPINYYYLMQLFEGQA